MHSPNLLALLTLATAALSSPILTMPLKRQLGSGGGTLFGPITFPGINFSNASITLVNFNDEVFDISSISIFGDINDGGCTEATPESDAAASEQPTRTSVFGPAQLPWSAVDVSSAQITLVNFNDEVFDISSISVFGDVNDGVCPSPSA
ncbi:uncharacterized protein K489DRAFT_72645 [Dissoconium aciculare CBS 342.82]|uniref:Uncharacterized protein n=1 Tax=Dissoconium aciculare CBS 342.82 TaxID=1314786 RepID=A0A6J3LTU5_9PEZI|nr:uncharacterized protein K489DRAFT_72645 [Dissoconium aciculare CBS 342.82]KAF1819053.1 hypothetical protein K489DRAFT_72645 [Dissoconium aciculare CBS 342.82]